MKLFILLATMMALSLGVSGFGQNIICYYNPSTYPPNGATEFNLNDLEIALQFCTHLVYGYAGINRDTYQLKSINYDLDIQRRHFATVTALKNKFPYVKFLLSVGGDKDLHDPEKYIQLLEGGEEKHNAFIQSARDMVKTYGFDGLDLALQLPRNKPRKVHSDLGSIWKGFKKVFTGDFVVDEQAPIHRTQITTLVTNLRNAFRPDNLMLTLTVLPNVNSSWYYNGPALIQNLDFVTLAAYDFLTPERNPEEGDFTAPIYEPQGQDRLGHYNVDFQVDYWLQQRVPANKIYLGIPAHGRAWKTTSDTGTDGVPLARSTDGPAPGGPILNTPGFWSQAEICSMLPNENNAKRRGSAAPLSPVRDDTKRYGSYAFRVPDNNGDHGVWVSYEDPLTAVNKAAYSKVKALGGIAIFDITLDDFRGQCAGEKYPLLRAVRYELNKPY